MNKLPLAGFVFAAASLFLLPAPALRAQGGGGAALLGGNGPGVNGTFTIKAITPSTPLTPQFTTSNGDDALHRSIPAHWLEIEVEFSSSAPAREVNFRFNVLIGNALLVGEQTVVDIPARPNGGLFTAMYVAPRTLATLLGNQPLTPNSVQNIDVQIMRSGVAQPVANDMLKKGGPAFYATMQQVPGFVLPKAQTPFANLYWDRYEAVRPAQK